MTIAKHFIALFLILLLTGCSNKIAVETLSSNEITLDKNKKAIYLHIENKTEENIFISYDIKKGLEDLGYTLVDESKESQYHLNIDIVFAAKIDKNSRTKDILRDINVNIGIGKNSGNFGIYTSVGATIGRILGDKLDSSMYQVVVDLSINERQKEQILKEENTQFILTAPLDGREKKEVIYFIEEEISKKVLALFK